MNRLAIVAVASIFWFGSVGWAVPPRVVKTTPDNGSTEVDPATKWIVVEFDQAMNHGGRSIVGGGPNFPTIDQINWRSDRTIAIGVTLEPEHDYRLSINSGRFTNFRNTNGEPCIPYPIAFKTAVDKNAPALDVAVNRRSIEDLRRAIDDNYSYRDLRKVDWDRLFADNTAELEKSPTPRQFAQRAGQMLSAAGDIHMSLRIGQTSFPTQARGVPPNMNIQTLRRLVPGWQEFAGGSIVTGKFSDGITYIQISTWSSDLAAQLDPIFVAIAEADGAKGLIIDVRSNSGGSEPLAMQVAGSFVAEPKVYSKHQTRRTGQWSGFMSRTVTPNEARLSYRGKVAVLIGRHCMSSNESFILMMKSAGATLVGETTYGSSGNPRPFELANGVTIILPSWKDLFPDGQVLEGVGITPDILIKTQPSDFTDRDPVLEAGLTALRS